MKRISIGVAFVLAMALCAAGALAEEEAIKPFIGAVMEEHSVNEADNSVHVIPVQAHSGYFWLTLPEGVSAADFAGKGIVFAIEDNTRITPFAQDEAVTATAVQALSSVSGVVVEKDGMFVTVGLLEDGVVAPDPETITLQLTGETVQPWPFGVGDSVTVIYDAGTETALGVLVFEG